MLPMTNHFCVCVHTNYFTMLKFVVIKVSLCCCFLCFFVSLFIEFILRHMSFRARTGNINICRVNDCIPGILWRLVLKESHQSHYRVVLKGSGTRLIWSRHAVHKDW